MGFTRSTTDISVHQKLGDYPNQDNGLSAEELKKRYDLPAETLQKDLNNLIDELDNKKEGFEASNYLTASKMYDGDESENTIQKKLEKLKEMIDEAVTGTIPDNSIDKAKLKNEFVETISTNEQMGILYLASKYQEATNQGIISKEYQSPSLTSSSHEGYNLSADYRGVKNIDDIYTMIGGDGSGYMYGIRSLTLTLELPKYIKTSSAQMTLDEYLTKGELQGSVDGINYETITSYTVEDFRGENYAGFSEPTKVTINASSNNKFYKFIRIVHTYRWDSEYIHIHNDIVFYGEEIDNLNQTNILNIMTDGNAKLTSYEKGQILKLETPNTYIKGTNISSTININSIGNRNLPNDLGPNKRYSLIYDGEKFIHEEAQNG